MRGRDWFFHTREGSEVWLNPTNISFVELERADGEEVVAEVHMAGAEALTFDGEDAQELIKHLENFGFFAESK
jgi:hypothetical protein